MLQLSVDTTYVEYLDSFSESKSGFTPACGVDIFDEILATSDACNASSLQSAQNDQNVIEMIKFRNQARLLRCTNIFEWSETSKQSPILNTLLMLLSLYQLL